MGEFHYSRYPETEWRRELLKMKAGGVDIVATYVFWIHHQQEEGQFDWSGCRDLRAFIKTVGQTGLLALVRCGPWCHGEVRNGGFPDWLLDRGWRLRSDDPNYLEKVRILYGQIASQLEGLLWKDGGPVIGIQLENEYGGPAEHLITLKDIARKVGLEVPLYTRTGWPSLRTPIPFGQILPLYGVYAEGFWDRQITPMPGNYWAGFHFSTLRADRNIANDLLGNRQASDPPDVAMYPYLTCEIGGGMMNSYHRRVLIRPEDIESISLVKLGSGSSLLGYYMYHGGVNPDGLTTLMESQDTRYTNYNDMPVKNYDFQAPLGQYGQVRHHYHLLRRLHLFVHDFGQQLVRMKTFLPDDRPKGKDDLETVRWAVRCDGRSGFVFVNNYQRLARMPAKEGVWFELDLPIGQLRFPDRPFTVPADMCFLWPFNLQLGPIKLIWATAQPICCLDLGDKLVFFFAKTDGVPATFAFEKATELQVLSGKVEESEEAVLVKDVMAGRSIAMRALAGNSAVQIVLLDSKDSLGIWKAQWDGRQRVFISDARLLFDGEILELESEDKGPLSVCIFPGPDRLRCGDQTIEPASRGIFAEFTCRLGDRVVPLPSIQKVQDARGLRRIRIGSRGVAAAPDDAAFEDAAVWLVKLPDHLDLDLDPILRIVYVGDVARVTLDGRLLIDDFFNGSSLEIGLARYGHKILEGRLEIAILPLPRDAPIYFSDPGLAIQGQGLPAQIKDIRLVYRRRCQLIAR
jgi:hypothetical protein